MGTQAWEAGQHSCGYPQRRREFHPETHPGSEKKQHLCILSISGMFSRVKKHKVQYILWPRLVAVTTKLQFYISEFWLYNNENPKHIINWLMQINCKLKSQLSSIYTVIPLLVNHSWPHSKLFSFPSLSSLFYLAFSFSLSHHLPTKNECRMKSESWILFSVFHLLPSSLPSPFFHSVIV